jgi:hypothetical protein
MKFLQIFSLVILFVINSYGQDSTIIKTKIISTFHTSNKIINILSFGFISSIPDERNVTTNGIRLEVPGLGLISFMGNGFPTATEPFDLKGFKYSEIVNGINISSGSWCNCNFNGLTIAGVGQYGKFGNGFSLAGGWNLMDKQNGLQLSMIANNAFYLNGVQISAFNFAHDGKGLQIGIFNNSKNFKGIQIGLWNVNQKRKLPLINWNFD